MRVEHARSHKEAGDILKCRRFCRPLTFGAFTMPRAIKYNLVKKLFIEAVGVKAVYSNYRGAAGGGGLR